MANNGSRLQALAARDGLAKAIYSRMFDWLVERLNIALKSTSPDLCIGVLVSIYNAIYNRFF